MKQLIRQILREEVSEKLKKIIKNKLSKDLSHAEIIFDKKTKSIWLIDLENEYWYFELEKTGDLWWREEFFLRFFNLFSITRREFEPIIEKWVENLLNKNVISIEVENEFAPLKVQDLLNQKTRSSYPLNQEQPYNVRELIQNRKK
jgi:hypothetical protein